MPGLLDLFDPNVRRLGLLPYPQGSLLGQKGPVEWSNWVAPQLAVDMAKAIDLPGRAWRGEQISPDDVTKMAMDTMGGSGLLSRAIPTGDVGGLLGINVFHGGPHRWSPEPGFPQGRPRMDKIGTGQGVQAYGHGFYGAEAKGVGKSHQAETAFKYGQRDMAEMLYSQKLGDTDAAIKSLSREMVEYDKRGWPSPDYRKQYDEALQKLEGFKTNPPEGGTLYKLDIPDADAAKYLDYDKPLSEQPEHVKKAWDSFQKSELGVLADDALGGAISGQRGQFNNPIGKDIYAAFVEGAASKVGPDKFAEKADYKLASEALRKAGIPGLKYFDQGSRGTREGTRNYVTWDQNVLDRAKILERDGKPTGLLGQVNRQEKIQKLREEATAQRFGEQDINTDYRMMHQPAHDGAARLDDMTGGGEVFPDDIYSSQGFSIYGGGTGDYLTANKQSYNKILKAKGTPNAEITIYRAVPNDDSIKTINPGDFVTLSRKYADLHAGSGYGTRGIDAGKVLSKKVKVRDVFSDGNDLNEFGYFPNK